MQRKNNARRIGGAYRGCPQLLRLLCCLAVVSLSFFGQLSYASESGHGPKCISMMAQSTDANHVDLSGAGDSGKGSHIRFHSTCSAGACLPIGLRVGITPAVVPAKNIDLLLMSEWDDRAGRPVAPGYRPPISV